MRYRTGAFAKAITLPVRKGHILSALERGFFFGRKVWEEANFLLF